jgi:peptidoglycan/LPS O-acetylase OafA/YrhL
VGKKLGSFVKYRPEIDGLRALAVSSVVVFHVNSGWVSAGYLGVDIFFVISGYLISQRILNDLSEERFSLLEFYERRARRIMPALIFAAIVTIPFAFLLMPPQQYETFYGSLVSIALFSSNIFFWKKQDYFATAAGEQPLLHTWSLAVEEQFYLLFPITVFLIWRYARRSLVFAICIGTVLSIIMATWGTHNMPAATFYLAPMRAWELLMGTIVAVVNGAAPQRFKPRINLLISNGLSLTGLVLIAATMFLLDESSLTTLPHATFVVLGSALIILFATEGTIVQKILANRLLVAMGLISYSLYLWHQPLLAFTRLFSSTTPETWQLVLAATAAIPIAYVSWRYVEKPFRSPKTAGITWILRRTPAFIVAIFTFGVASYFFDATGRFQSSRFLEAKANEQRLQANHGMSPACEFSFTENPKCRNSDLPPQILLWGDSYAMHAWQAISQNQPQLSTVQMTVSGCGPILDIAPIDSNHFPKWGQNCIATNDKVMQYLKQHRSIKYAVLSSSLNEYVGAGQQVVSRDGVVNFGQDVTFERFEKTLRTIKSLGVKPIIIAPPPSNGSDTGQCFLKSALFGSNSGKCQFSESEALLYQAPERQLLHRIESDYEVIWFDKAICENDICLPQRNGVWLYRDSGHLSIEGSKLLGQTLQFGRLFTAN